VPVFAVGWWWKKKGSPSSKDPLPTPSSLWEGSAIQQALPIEGEMSEGQRGSVDVRKTEGILLQATELIQKNLDNPAYGIESLCADMAVSRMNLYRKFQAVTQQTPSEYIRSIRLQHGADLLRGTDQSVSEVAYAVGFTSPQYFIKCFKEEFGETPKKFRQQKSSAQK
jgi:AraC-like DNA-binding protein